mmetsp:Transcript_82668/g.232727  ORF Transcript_82668/g.232727 Transcript_82668/m.232727 type:complete len:378 (-) Transcript_82668:24-1157(-)
MRISRGKPGMHRAVPREDCEVPVHVADDEVLRALLRGHCDGSDVYRHALGAIRHSETPVELHGHVHLRAQVLRELVHHGRLASLAILFRDPTLLHADLVHTDDAAHIAGSDDILVVQRRHSHVREGRVVARNESRRELAGRREEPQGAIELRRHQQRGGHRHLPGGGRRGSARVPQRQEGDGRDLLLLPHDRLGDEVITNSSSSLDLLDARQVAQLRQRLLQQPHVRQRQPPRQRARGHAVGERGLQLLQQRDPLPVELREPTELLQFLCDDGSSRNRSSHFAPRHGTVPRPLCRRCMLRSSEAGCGASQSSRARALLGWIRGLPRSDSLRGIWCQTHEQQQQRRRRHKQTPRSPRHRRKWAQCARVREGRCLKCAC